MWCDVIRFIDLNVLRFISSVCENWKTETPLYPKIVLEFKIFIGQNFM